jgi:hypothetical protein
MVHILLAHLSKAYAIILVTGRPEECRSLTLDWLARFGIIAPDDCLFMRANGDYRPDEIVKREIYERFIMPRLNVRLVVDDRDRVVKMWRSLGLECWQVAEGDF